MKRHGSLCADRDTFVKLIRDELSRQKDLETKAFPAALGLDEKKRHEAFVQLGKDSGPKVRELKNAAGAVDVHKLLDGEAVAQKPLRDALWALADSAARINEDLERHGLESNESYESAIRILSKTWVRDFAKVEKKVGEHLAEVEKVCK